MVSEKKQKIIVIIGPTSSGKTALAVALACKLNGEIISADSRQVYKYMDVGTGKDLGEYRVSSDECRMSNDEFRMTNDECRVLNNEDDKFKKNILTLDTQHSTFVNIPYHLIDVVHPNEKYDLAKWLTAAQTAIIDISKRGRLPIVAGGSGLYAQALVDGFALSTQGQDSELRASMEKKNADELFAVLSGIDKKFAERLNNSERNNARRLIRYIEICGQGENIKKSGKKQDNPYDCLLLGISRPLDVLRERIHKRLIERLEKEDMIGEVRGLHYKQGVSWVRLESFGLEYKFIARYLQGKMDYDDMTEKLNIAIRQYAKRQLTWLKRWEKQGARINWLLTVDEAEILARNFLEL